MARYDFDIGVLGGGSAGLTVAAGAAQLGAKTLLIDKEKDLGGDCLHYGCVPSKTLIKTAKVCHEIKNSAKYGLPVIDLPPINFEEITERIRRVVATIQQRDSAERFCKLGARVETGIPEFEDEHIVRVNGERYSAKNWVIATGSSPDIPGIPGLSTESYITNRELFSLGQLPGSLVIIGGGPVGIEMAQAFARLGTHVTVLQDKNQILPQDDTEMAGMILRVLQSEGVIFHLNCTIRQISESNGEKILIIDTNGKEILVRGRVILIAAGRTANLEGLGLEKAGVEYDRKGLNLDRRLRTTQPHIYGAGDVTGQFLFTHAAGYEGGVTIANAVFHLPKKVDYSLMPWCTFTDPELACIGINERQAKANGMEHTVWKEEFRLNDRSTCEDETTGMIKMILDAKEKPIGIQMVGPRAGDLLNEWSTAMNGKIKLSTLASTVHIYPTLAEINKKIAGNFMSTKLFSEKMRRGLKIFFNLRGRACDYGDRKG